MIEKLTDKAFKDAVFAMVVDDYCKDFDTELDAFMERFDNQPETIDFDFDSVTELEVTAPVSLDDLEFFPNLERLTICGYSDYMITEINYWQKVRRDGIKEIILRKDLG